MQRNCGVEQLVARRAHNPEVASSSPAPATTKECESILFLQILVINSKLLFIEYEALKETEIQVSSISIVFRITSAGYFQSL